MLTRRRRPVEVETGFASVEGFVVSRDPWVTVLFVTSAVAAVTSGGRAAIVPLAIAGGIGLWLVRSGDPTGARVFFLALTCRNLATVASKWIGVGRALFPDESDILTAAAGLAGTGKLESIPAFGTANIGYLYVPFVWAGGPRLESIRLASALAGAAGVLALWVVGRWIVGTRAARRAAVAYAVFPSAVVWTGAGLKEGFVAFFGIVATGLAVRASTDPDTSRAVFCIGGAGAAVALLEPLRESLALAIGALLVLGCTVFPRGIASKVFRTSTAAVALALVFWMVGYGVMGVGVVGALDPAYWNRAYELGSSGAPAEAPSGESSTPEERRTSQLVSAAKRIPSGVVLVLIRPLPWDGPQGGLAEHGLASTMLIVPDSLAWYLAAALGSVGAWRGLRSHPRRTAMVVGLVLAVTFFYSLTQANLGTAYRHRAALIPLVLLMAAFAVRPRSRDWSNVGLVIPTLNPGGTEEHVVRVAAAVADSGRTATVISFTGGPLAERITKLEVTGKTAKLEPRLPFVLRTFLARVDVASTYLFAGNFWGGLGARLANRPLMTNVRTSHPRHLFGKMTESLLAGEVVVANSLAVARAAASRGVDPARMVIIRSGISPPEAVDRDLAREALGVESEALLFVTPGRIDPLKGQSAAIRAFANAISHQPKTFENAVLCVAGPAVLEREKEYFALLREEASPLGERIKFAGPEKIDMAGGMRCVIGAADAVVLASTHEGLPTVAIEAMWMGIPVVATSAGGTPEVVADGVTGLLSPVGDVPAMASNIVEIAVDAELRKEMGRAALRRAREKFSAEDEAVRILSALELTVRRAAEADAPAPYGDRLPADREASAR